MKISTLSFRKTLCLILFCVLFTMSSILSACQPTPTYQKYIFYDMDALDTLSNLQIFLTPKQDKEYYRSWFSERLQHYHRLFDAYNSYEGVNNVYTINQNAGIAPVAVEKELYDLITFSLAQSDITEGRTNIAMGKVTMLWKDYMSAVIASREMAAQLGTDPVEVSLPTQTTLLEAAEHMDLTCIHLDEATQTVYLSDPEMCLDVGAVAKGYIAELLADELQAMGIAAAILNLGGNTKVIGQRVMGDGPSYFLCDITDPTTGGELGLHIRMDDQACLVTSGNYQRFVDVDGIRYHHLVDPDTLLPAQGYYSVTIVAKDSGLADYLSTALFTVDVETGKEILSHYEGIEVFWITDDLQIAYTDGFPALVDNWAKGE